MSKITCTNVQRRRQRVIGRKGAEGVSLIEVLVSVVVLSIGLLGVAAMQSIALRGGQSSLETSQAVIQTNSILDAMRANRINAGAYNTPGMVCAAGGAPGTLAQNDVSVWIGALKNTIGRPGDTTTCGSITGCPDACVITVQWDDQRAGGGAARTIVTGSRI